MTLSNLFLWNPIVWNVSPEIIDFGFFALRWYGLLFALGFVFGQRILTRIYKAEGRTEQDVDVITLYMIIGTVLGARLGHCLFYEPEVYLSDPIRILKIWEGGLASHGATIGILLSLYLFSRNHKFDYLWVLDRIVIVVALGGALIRLGNLFNSEIVGKVTDVPWAFVFPLDVEHLVPATSPLPAGAVAVPLENRSLMMALPRHPAQLYEAISTFLLFLFLYYLWNRRKSFTPRGLLFGLFVVILFTLRFVYEFLKENQVDKEDFLLNTIGMNIGQLLSIPLIIIGLFILIRAITKPTYVNPVTGKI